MSTPCPDGNICTLVATKTTCVPLFSQQLGSPDDDVGQAIAVDASGNVYVTGSARGALEANTYAGGDDIFIVKYDESVQKQWFVELGTTANENGAGIAADQDGNVYVTGATLGGLDGNTSAGAADVFVVKYDTAGQKQWTRQLGTKDYDLGAAIATDGSGGLYVAGQTQGGLDGNMNVGDYDVFVAKYDTAGQKIWTRQLGSIYPDGASGVAVDSDGNVYVTGSTKGALDGNTSAGAYDIFVVKYDPMGSKKWTQQLGTQADDFARGIAVDGSGHVYVTGSTSGNLGYNTNKGGKDLFVVQYDSDGGKHWIDTDGTSSQGLLNTDDEGYGVATDRAGNVYVTGYTKGALVTGSGYYGAPGGGDMFIKKYDGDGGKLWTHQYGTSSEEEGLAIAGDGDQNVYVTGYTGFRAAGSKPRPDVFVARYDSNGNRLP